MKTAILTGFALACMVKFWVAVKMAKQDDNKFERQSAYIAELEQKINKMEDKQ